jgi:hypothetical protein
MATNIRTTKKLGIDVPPATRAPTTLSNSGPAQPLRVAP